MSSRCGLRGTLLSVSLAACGRLGVDLLPLPEDASVVPPDAGTPLISASIPEAPDGDVGTASADAGPVALDLDAALAEAAADGRTPPQPDAAAVDPTMLDAAAIEAGADAGLQDACGDASTLSCAGEVVLGVCWYLGPPGVSCTNLCSTHGGFDIAATRCLGSASQGGSLGHCHQVLSAFGITADVNLGMRTDSLGIGCHVWSDGRPWWLYAPDANPDSATSAAQVACGCNQ